MKDQGILSYFYSSDTESTEKLRLVLLMLYAFSLPFNLFFSSVIFITLAVLSLVDISKEKLKRIPKQIWLFQGVFYLGLLSYYYSLHHNKAGFLLERQLSILLFPVFLPLAIQISYHKIRLILFALALSCVLTAIYLFSSMIFTIHNELHLPLIKTAFSGAFFNHQFSKPINIHAGYLSLYFVLALIYLITEWKEFHSKFAKLIFLSSYLILFAALFFLASRNAIITGFFILVFIYPVFFVRKKWLYMVCCLTGLCVLFFVLRQIPYFKERFSVELISDIKPLDNGKIINYSATEPRIERWKCGIELIKESPLIGYGSGDEVDVLKVKYAQKGMFISYLESFNAHNQYLSIFIKHGIFGLFLFCGIFYYYLKLALRNSVFIYLSFLILLLFGFYTENILDANKGIVFFAFFNTLFGYYSLQKSKT